MEPLSIEQAWKLIFKEHAVLERVEQDGVFYITSREINRYKEARLMAKFDQSAQLPELFRRHQFSILPVTRGRYAIGPFSTHAQVVYSDVRPKHISPPALQTLNHKNLYSEASALLFAYHSGIIQDVLGSEKVFYTVNGRMASGNFQFTIDSTQPSAGRYTMDVQNAQLEIDAGYESPEAFCICEAKNMASTELLVRQLYYPYRLWSAKIEKPVLPVFLAVSNDVFHVFQYTFEDKTHYNSLKLLRHSAYTFSDEPVVFQEVADLWKSIAPLDEPDVTFPQADSFARVVDLLSVLHEHPLTRNEVTLQYEFDPRQTNYYIAACAYLGFLERRENKDDVRVYQLTAGAKKIMGLGYHQKQLALIRAILERPVFYEAFRQFLASGHLPEKHTICSIMKRRQLRINEVTIGRRASTVRGWLEWILGMSTDELRELHDQR